MKDELLEATRGLGDQVMLRTLVTIALTRPARLPEQYEDRHWVERCREALQMLNEARTRTGGPMRLTNLHADWDIRPGEHGLVVAELVVGVGAGKVKMSFGLSAADAAKLGRGFAGAAKLARNKKAADASTRIATRLLKKAAAK